MLVRRRSLLPRRPRSDGSSKLILLGSQHLFIGVWLDAFLVYDVSGAVCLVYEEYRCKMDDGSMITTMDIINASEDIKREAYEGQKKPNQAVS